MSIKKLYILILSSLIVSSCGFGQTNNLDSADDYAIKRTGENIHELPVRLEIVKEPTIHYLNDLEYTFVAYTIDTVVPNLWTDQIVAVEKIIGIDVLVDGLKTQKIRGIDEIAAYYTKEDRYCTIILEGINRDNYLDLCLEISSRSKRCDRDIKYFLYNNDTNTFEDSDEYKMRHLTDEEFKELYGPDSE